MNHSTKNVAKNRNLYKVKVFLCIVAFCCFLLLRDPHHTPKKLLKNLIAYDYNHFDESPYINLTKFNRLNITQDNINQFTEVLSHKTCSSNSSSGGKAAVTLVPEDECSAPFLFVNDGGRLGNNICEYLTLLYFRKRFGVRVIISRKMRNSIMKIFEKLPTPFSPSLCFKATTSKKTYGFQRMFEAFENVTRSNISLNVSIPANTHLPIRQSNFIAGYPCPLDYLINYREEFRSKLKIKKSIEIDARKSMEEHLAKNNRNKTNVTLISIHVRRSDYIRYAKSRSVKIPTAHFYKKAMDFYRKRISNVAFMAVTDDLKWVKENIKDDDLFFPGTSDIQNPLLDWTLLNLCHHHIFGVGTFGATSAFLGQGTIIYFADDTVAKLFDEIAPSFKCWSSLNFIPMTD